MFFRLYQRLPEFFEGDDGRMSMARLMIFMSFFPASYVVVLSCTEMALGVYLSAYVGGYLGGKGADIFKQNRGGKDAV